MITVSDNNYLNNVWKQWLDANLDHSSQLNHNYSRVARRIPVAQKFEDWLWVQGASIIRDNRKCYLQFTNEEDAIIFKLRHGI